MNVEGRRISALMVDDELDSAFIRGVVKGAAEYGVDIKGIPGGDDIRSQLQHADADVVILDLKMSANAKQLARQCVRAQPGVAIFFWTGYPADPEFLDLDQTMNPLVRCAKGAKLKGADVNRQILANSLIAPIAQLLEASRPGARDQESLTEDHSGTGIFRMTVEEFCNLDQGTAMEVLHDAMEQCKPASSIIFEESQAEWLLVAGPQLDVIRWGASLANMPDSARMRDLGNRYGYMPVLVVRPVEADELGFIGGQDSGWSECGPGDFYPTLGVDFLRGKTKTGQVHLDTGTPRTLLSLEELEAAGALGDYGNMDLREAVRLPSQPFIWLDKRLTLVLSDGRDSRTVDVRVMVVKDWKSSPFTRMCSHGSCPGSEALGSKYMCGRRAVGLLGRDLLIAGQLVLVLDGVERRTKFLGSTEPERRQRRRLFR